MTAASWSTNIQKKQKYYIALAIIVWKRGMVSPSFFLKYFVQNFERFIGSKSQMEMARSAYVQNIHSNSMYLFGGSMRSSKLQTNTIFVLQTFFVIWYRRPVLYPSLEVEFLFFCQDPMTKSFKIS